MSDTSGPTLPEPLAFYDPESSSWRMSAGTFPWEPQPSLETLPASGLTLDGVLYELPMSAPATAVPGCSSLPTPQANLGEHRRYLGQDPAKRKAGGHSVSVADVVRFLPTSTTEPMTGNGHARNLGKEVALLPTPAANQYEMHDVDAYLERRERCKETAQNGNGFGLVLAMAVKMLPTPAAWDADRGPDYARMGREDSGGDDLVTTLARFSGERMRPPSPDTPPSSDAPPLTLWTDEGD